MLKNDIKLTKDLTCLNIAIPCLACRAPKPPPPLIFYFFERRFLLLLMLVLGQVRFVPQG